jgi:SAM-dependent methyltransferase
MTPPTATAGRGPVAVPLAYDPAEAHPLVTALFADQLGDPAAVDAAVHGDDEMLAYLAGAHGDDRDAGLVSYFTTGLSIARALAAVVRWRFGGWAALERALDFASGFGRVTRYLVREIAPRRLWVAEIQPAAVAFQAARFGVHALPSTLRPGDFRAAGGFGAIFVTSLFTHLPAETFTAWLGRLAELLAPGGLLAFTTHGAELLDAGVVPEGGILFHPVSETDRLAGGDYGSTWVSEAFVRAAVERAAPGFSCHRLRRAVNNFQDLYLVVPEPEADFSGLAFAGEPKAYAETFFRDREGHLFSRGWAYDPGWGRPVEEVRLLVDGHVVGRCREFGCRPDLAAVAGIPIPEALDWSLRGPLPAGVSLSRVALMVKVMSAGGGEHVLHLSTLESALLWSARREIERYREDLARAALETEQVRAEADLEIEGLEYRIAAMEASRFWKLRNAWFRLKKALGLVRTLDG